MAYTLLDSKFRRAIKQIDSYLADQEYALTGGAAVQLLIAQRLGLEHLLDSELLRETSDLDILVNLDFISLQERLLSQRPPFSFYKKVEKGRQQAVKYKIADLGISFYPAQLKPEDITDAKISYKGKEIKAKVLRPEALLVEKLDNGRPKDIGDVERLLLVYGKDLNKAEIYARIDELRPERAQALRIAYKELKARIGV